MNWIELGKGERHGLIAAAGFTIALVIVISVALPFVPLRDIVFQTLQTPGEGCLQVTRKGITAIRTPDEWTATWNASGPCPEPPIVDFRTGMVLLVVHGQGPETVTVQKFGIERVVERIWDLEVETALTMTSPAVGTGSIHLIYDMVVIENNPKPLTLQHRLVVNP